MKLRLRRFFKNLGRNIEECQKCKEVFELEIKGEKICPKCKSATYIRDLEGYSGVAKLYHLEPPLIDYNENVAEYVVVSATNVVFSGPETFIFRATESGIIVDWGELKGSFRGALNHKQALNEAGYRRIL